MLFRVGAAGLLLCRRRGRLGGGCWLRLRRRGFHTRKNRSRRRGAGPRGQDRKRDRGQHEDNRRPRGGLRKGSGRATWAEGRLTTLAAEGGGNVATLTALQQNDHDQKEANRDMNERHQVNHVVDKPNRPSGRPLLFKIKALVRKGGFEPPRLSAPPPQDGVSASSTTSAGTLRL